MLLGFHGYETQAQNLASALELPLYMVERHRFPDDEFRLLLPPRLSGHVVFCQSLDRPNEKLIELLLAARSARLNGAESLTLVAPYLCYMRQDKAFHAGEVVSQPIVGRFLADLFDHVVTVDPHLHRIHHLSEAIPTNAAVSLTATSLMAEFLRQRSDDPVLLGPDEEAEQWVRAVASPGRRSYGVCSKKRLGDRRVEVSLPAIDLRDRAVVLVDDVASSGQTLVEASRQCLARQARRVDVLVTHALFAGEARQNLADAGVGEVWSTDSVSHETNAIPLAGILRDAVASLA